MPIHNERASRLLSAIRAVAASDVYRVTAHAVADRPAEASAGAYSPLHTEMVRNTAVRQRAYATTETRRQGNSEGTPARVLASTRDHAPSDESSFLVVFRAPDFPALPAVPASLLDGREGVSGSSPEEGFRVCPAQAMLLLPLTATAGGCDVHEASTDVHRSNSRASRSRIACSRPSRAWWP
jgi:hypothetical protein